MKLVILAILIATGTWGCVHQNKMLKEAPLLVLPIEKPPEILE